MIPVILQVFLYPSQIGMAGLKSKYEEINEEDIIPELHKEIVRNRINEYNNNTKIGLDFGTVLTELENE
ncbi:MAG: hypothetical protein WAU01_02265 [Saprospiraceae bacterium]